MKDMNRADILAMREGGMGNVAIAQSLVCSTKTVWDLIGAQPKEITNRNRQLGIQRAKEERWSNKREGGYTVERKMKSFMPHDEPEEETIAALVVKASPIWLHGEYMEYTIAADKSRVDVYTGDGAALISVPRDKLKAFIAELQSIEKHIDTCRPMEFWGC